MEKQTKRKEIYIWTSVPSPDVLHPQFLLVGYLETAKALTETNHPVIHTTQIVFLDHMWILAGYDLYLCDKNLVYKFGEQTLSEIMRTFPNGNIPRNYLLDQYRWGMLTQA